MCMTLSGTGMCDIYDAHDVCGETIGSVCPVHVRVYTHTWSSRSTSSMVITKVSLLLAAARGLKYGSRSRSVDMVRKSLASEVPGGCTLSPLVVAHSPLMGSSRRERERESDGRGSVWQSVVNSQSGLTERQQPGGSENSRSQIRCSNSEEHECLMACFAKRIHTFGSV